MLQDHGHNRTNTAAARQSTLFPLQSGALSSLDYPLTTRDYLDYTRGGAKRLALRASRA